ncbi:hypothetical protein [Hyphococcus sp.]|uniref:hypothetical protein n=1 Tax=Hyphococcus sp. TaxID=2038636 RepID=UPI0035C77F3D
MPDDPENGGFAEELNFEADEDPFACSPEHEAYIRREVSATLARKAKGEVKYTSLDEAARKFIPDAC